MPPYSFLIIYADLPNFTVVGLASPWFAPLWSMIIECILIHYDVCTDSSRDTQMVLAALTSLQMEPSCGQVVWITRCVCGICVKADNYSNMTLHLKSSHLATVPLKSG